MSAHDDRQRLIEAGELDELVQEEGPGPQPIRGGRAGRLRAGLAAATLACAACAALLALRRGGAARGQSTAEALEAGMLQLVLNQSQCALYTDCAALQGNCCPTDLGTMLGCCSSPKLDASPAPVLEASLEASPEAAPGQCADTAGWANGYSLCALNGYNIMQGCTPMGMNCAAYSLFSWCANGAVLPGREWTAGPALREPEKHCCACGKPSEPAPATPAPTTGEPAAPPTQGPVAPTTLGPVSAGTPWIVLPADQPPQPTVAPAPVTAAPLAGGAAPNGTQGEPVGADCAMNEGCKDLGIEGQCCPTADGTMLGCCSPNLAAGPKLLPPANSSGPLMTFYMYRVSNDQDYPLNGVNMANLAGDMWYLHNEVVGHCPRKFDMTRLVRFKVTMRATPELYGQGRNFDAFVAFDEAKCTVPMCDKLHWEPYGYVVGCQPNNVQQVAVPGTPAWYSLPGTCPDKFYYQKTEACNSAEPGGACLTSDVTGSRNCTYYLERAGEIRLDELSGLKDYNNVCAQTGELEYNEETDTGVGTKFWDGKADAVSGARRVQIVKELFAQRFPSEPLDLEDPTCDVPQ